MEKSESVTTEDNISSCESVGQISNCVATTRGCKRGTRGRQKKNGTVSNEEIPLNGNLQVASLKHVGKFRYLSNLPKVESKPAANQGKGNCRDRGRSYSNHVPTTQGHVTETQSHVSSRGRRIKPNNRWASDADFDPGPTKPITGRTYTRRTNKNVTKRTTAARKVQGGKPTAVQENVKNEEKSTKSSKATCKFIVNKDENIELNLENVHIDQSVLGNTEIVVDINGEQASLEVTKEEIVTTHSKESVRVSASKLSSIDEVIEAVVKQWNTVTGRSPATSEVLETEEPCSEETVTIIESSSIFQDSEDKTTSLIPNFETQDIKFDLDHPTIETMAVAEEVVLVSSETIDKTCEVYITTEIEQEPLISDDCKVEYVEVDTSNADVPPDSVDLPAEEVESVGVSVSVLENQQPALEIETISEIVLTPSQIIPNLTKEVKILQMTAEAACSSSAGSTPVYEESVGNNILISPKPVKVKSRWRRTSELEQATYNGNSDQSSCNNSPLTLSPRSNVLTVRSENQNPEECQEKSHGLEKETEKLSEEKWKSFESIEENLYLTGRKTSKEVKRMLCDCTLTKEEIARGELGCGEDCLNRLLMIECGPRCQLCDRCTNKRFQRKQYAKVEVFQTEKKGFGLRTLQDLEPGDFVIEYVGEVLDPKEFRRRAKEYARDKNKHYYFMALKSDSIIDATQKGNISRFINHSCDPNAETQKWTVNGDLRVGFFIKKNLKYGEEITFDYQFQRYGKEAQRCFCESSNCRGWIGEDPDKEDKNKEKKEKKDKEKKKKNNLSRDDVDDMDLDEEIDKLTISGVKNQAHTLTLCRLMVRAEDLESRRNILSVLRNAEQACRRLFLDYHGLKLLWGWMIDATSNSSPLENMQFKIDLLSTLASLPVPNKTMLLDSKLLSVVEKWTEVVENLVPTIKKDEEGIEENELEKKDDKDDKATDLDTAVGENVGDMEGKIAVAAAQLLESWSNLKEVFRIPKKERIEKMKEHEREADQEYKESMEKEQNNRYSGYDRRPSNRLDGKDGKEKEKIKRSRESPDREARKVIRLENDNLTKHERRRLFALKVAKEDEELRLRKHQEEIWKRHLDSCYALGLDPNITPVNFDATPFTGVVSPGCPPLPVYWDPLLGTWQQYPDDGSYPGNPTVLTPVSDINSSTVVKAPLSFPILQLVVPAGYDPTSMGPLIMEFDSCEYESTGTPLVPSVLVVPLAPPENSIQTAPAEWPLPVVPPPPIVPCPLSLSAELPRRWRQAVDDRGRVYYYHVRRRIPQWEPPSADECTPDFSSEDEDEVPNPSAEEEAKQENVVEDVRTKRRGLLCQERIISPRSDFERSDDAQRYRELKERILRQKLARIRERGLWIEEKRVMKEVDREKNSDKEKRKLSEKEKEKLRKKAKEKYKRALVKNSGNVRRKNKEKVENKVDTPSKEDEIAECDRSGENVNKEKCLDSDNGFIDEDMMNLGEEDEARLTEDKTKNKDLSANTVRKIKDAFRMKISSVIVQILNPYRRPDCKVGRITRTEDFKHLARKLTHFVLAKELKHCRSIEELVVNDSVKHKAKDFIKKYMRKFGAAYRRGSDEDP